MCVTVFCFSLSESQLEEAAVLQVILNDDVRHSVENKLKRKRKIAFSKSNFFLNSALKKATGCDCDLSAVDMTYKKP